MSFPFSCVERPSSVLLVGLREQVFLVYPWTAPAEVLEGSWQCTALPQPRVLLLCWHCCHAPAKTWQLGEQTAKLNLDKLKGEWFFKYYSYINLVKWALMLCFCDFQNELNKLLLHPPMEQSLISYNSLLFQYILWLSTAWVGLLFDGEITNQCEAFARYWEPRRAIFSRSVVLMHWNEWFSGLMNTWGFPLVKDAESWR